ncbi:hypothetical protein BD560DRAFT_427155 [Blakeslea trispora]|nr:hypothetical protein BD560DRAFT_427155 [Blakeslea trispora]
MGNHIKAEKDLVYEVVKLTPFYATTVDSKRKDVTLEALEEAVPEKYMALLDKEISAAFEDDVSIASKDLTQLPRGNKHNDYLPTSSYSTMYHHCQCRKESAFITACILIQTTTIFVTLMPHLSIL